MNHGRSRRTCSSSTSDAGEQLSLVAAVMNDKFRAAGQGRVRETIFVRKKPSYTCIIRCGRGTVVDGVEAEELELQQAWSLGAADYAAMLSGVTGQTVTANQFMETGERI